MTVIRKRIFAVAAKIETTSGTYTEPAWNTDAFRLVGIPTLKINNLEEGDQDDVQTGVLIPAPRSTPGGRWGEIELALRVTGKGAAAGRVQHDALLRAAGFARTLVATPGQEKDEFTTLDDATETLSLLLWSGKKLYRMAGCVCSAVKISGVAGRPGTITFTVRGVLRYQENALANPQAAASIAGLQLSGAVPPAWASNTMLLGDPVTPKWGPASTEPLVAKTYDLDIANEVAMRDGAGAEGGLHGFVITGRTVTLTSQVEQVAQTTFDVHDAARSNGYGTGGSVVHDTRPQIKHGVTQFARQQIDGGYWELKPPEDADKDGLAVWQLTGRLSSYNGPGGRELKITYD